MARQTGMLYCAWIWYFLLPSKKYHFKLYYLCILIITPPAWGCQAALQIMWGWMIDDIVRNYSKVISNFFNTFLWRLRALVLYFKQVGDLAALHPKGNFLTNKCIQKKSAEDLTFIFWFGWVRLMGLGFKSQYFLYLETQILKSFQKMAFHVWSE